MTIIIIIITHNDNSTNSNNRNANNNSSSNNNDNHNNNDNTNNNNDTSNYSFYYYPLCPRLSKDTDGITWTPQTFLRVGASDTIQSNNSPEETPSPRRDSKKTGRYHVYYYLRCVLRPCFLGVSSWVWSLFWGI